MGGTPVSKFVGYQEGFPDCMWFCAVRERNGADATDPFARWARRILSQRVFLKIWILPIRLGMAKWHLLIESAVGFGMQPGSVTAV